MCNLGLHPHAQSFRGGQFRFSGNTNASRGGFKFSADGNMTGSMQQGSNLAMGGNVTGAGGCGSFSGNSPITPVVFPVVVPMPVLPSTNITSSLRGSGSRGSSSAGNSEAEPPAEQGNGGGQENP